MIGHSIFKNISFFCKMCQKDLVLPSQTFSMSAPESSVISDNTFLGSTAEMMQCKMRRNRSNAKRGSLSLHSTLLENGSLMFGQKTIDSDPDHGEDGSKKNRPPEDRYGWSPVLSPHNSFKKGYKWTITQKAKRSIPIGGPRYLSISWSRLRFVWRHFGEAWRPRAPELLASNLFLWLIILG